MASDDNTSVSSSIEHEFSSPWEDSDLVLVVEDQQLHVHRFILKMASPVFKAMLSSDFKEKEAAKIPLPGKNADDFVVLLKQIYPQFNRSSITLANVEHIYKLADEYQIESVCVACREVLKSVEKTKDNAMKILLKVQVCHADEARQQCYDILQQLTLDELGKNECFGELDGPSAKSILLPKARRLEKIAQKIPPNILGLFGWIFCLSRKLTEQGDSLSMTECSFHSRPYGYRDKTFFPVEVVKCKNCKNSLREVWKKFSGTFGRYYNNGTGIYVDENIVELLEEIYTVLEP